MSEYCESRQECDAAYDERDRLALEVERLRAALLEIKGKYAWQTEAGAIARTALTTVNEQTAVKTDG